MGYLKIPADSSCNIVFMEGNVDFDNVHRSLQVMQLEVGGYVESVVIGDYVERRRFNNVRMLVDEMGLIKGLPSNSRASYLYGQPVHGGVIAGDAVIVGVKETYEGLSWCDLPESWTVSNLDNYLANHDSSKLF